jgi:hypothetical protein
MRGAEYPESPGTGLTAGNDHSLTQLKTIQTYSSYQRLRFWMGFSLATQSTLKHFRVR